MAEKIMTVVTASSKLPIVLTLASPDCMSNRTQSCQSVSYSTGTDSIFYSTRRDSGYEQELPSRALFAATLDGPSMLYE